MFTGLVECMGRLSGTTTKGSARRLTIEANFASPLSEGESIAVSGICLTVEEFDVRTFSITAVAETLNRTTLGAVRPSESLNLERSLRLSDRLGGHLVTGHVDCVARVISQSDDGAGRRLEFEYPAKFDPFVIDKGSVAVDGVSLTVVEAHPGRFSVALIPLTCQITTLGALKAGDRANLEFDLVGKYIWKQRYGTVPSAVEEEIHRV